MPTAPLLVHVGYHKTATTWLQKALFASPEAGFAVPASYRELSDLLVVPDPLEYDPARARQRLLPALAGAPGRVPVVSVERLSGMPMQGGYDQKEMADRVFSTFPEARVLIVVREQVGMILSIYRHHVRHGGTVPLRRYVQPSHGPVFTLSYFEYHRLIGYYLDHLGRDRLLVLPYESFRREPAAFVNRITSFCGLPPVSEAECLHPFGARINPGESTVYAALQRRANRLIAPGRPGRPGGLLPLPRRAFHLFKKGLRGLDRLVPAGVEAALVRRDRATIASAVGDFFARSNACTERLAGVDLAALGYRVG